MNHFFKTRCMVLSYGPLAISMGHRYELWTVSWFYGPSLWTMSH